MSTKKSYENLGSVDGSNVKKLNTEKPVDSSKLAESFKQHSDKTKVVRK